MWITFVNMIEDCWNVDTETMLFLSEVASIAVCGPSLSPSCFWFVNEKSICDLGNMIFYLKQVPCFYRKHEWKFGRTRYAVGTRAAGECFHSFSEFSQILYTVFLSKTRVIVWENEMCCGNTSGRRVFPQLFRVLPNFHECFYNSTETRSTCFLFLLENNATRKRKTTC